MTKNIVANIVGKFWSLISNFLFIPLYIGILGTENYSIIAFSLIVVSFVAILDMGLSATISREMARSDVSDPERYRALKAFEKVYVAIIFGCAVVGLIASDYLANTFIRDTAIDRDLIAFCLRVVAVEAALQIVFRFYVNALMGLDRQVEANAFNVAWGIARNGLAVGAIALWPTLTVFFAWQLLATLALLIWVRGRLAAIVSPWRPETVKFADWDALRRIGVFAGGMFALSMMAFINTQLDRIVLSNLLNIKHLGYYTIAVSVGTGLLAVSSPFLSAMQPKLTGLFSSARGVEAGSLYLAVSTVVAVLVFPLAAVIGFNSESVVLTWTGNPEVAQHTASIIPWIVAAYALLSMSSMAFGVAMANGVTRYNNLIGLCTLVVSIPGYWLMIARYGTVGAAALYFAIQVGVSLVYHIIIDHRFLGRGTLVSGAQLFVVPAGVAIFAAWLWKLGLGPAPTSRILALVYLAAGYGAVMVAVSAVMAPLFKMRRSLSEAVRAAR